MTILEKIKLFFAAKKVLNQIEGVNMKSGWKSTEFWINLVSIAATLYGALGGLIPPALGLKIAAILLIAYTVSRSLVKAAAAIAAITSTPKDDAIVAGIGKVLDAIKDKFPGVEKPPVEPKGQLGNV